MSTKMSITVRDVHDQEGSQPSKIDPSKSIPVVITTVIATGLQGETGLKLELSTTDPTVAARYEVGQTIEVSTRPMGKLVVVEEPSVEDALVVEEDLQN